MKEYLMLFWNDAGDGQYQIDLETMKKSMDEWQAWIGNIAVSGKLISTKPIQYEGTIIGNNTSINKPSIVENKMVTGYLICKASSVNEVKKWAGSCPILKNPNGFTEIREVTPFDI